ncbi:endo-1,4-beta-xylanase [Micromonospora siamensis]|uniref:endo-1,4-beta-xylanase n=1 Tax=Micromonospora siamensis TaxID=299152 RepID=UPI000B5ACEBE|nr:endo-1,4-beta-xylanase [Micromonospora siamensis]
MVENEMKWESLETTRGSYDWGPADQLVAFATAHHQRVRGHVLAYQELKAELVYSGPPFVLPRVPQRPHR